MVTKNLKLLAVFSCCFIILYSCSDDIDLLDERPDQIGDINLDNNSEEEVIEAWNNQWLILDQHAQGMRPNATSRAIAYIQLTAYETAVDDIPSYNSNENRYNQLNINQNLRPDQLNLSVALNAAYASAIDHFMFNMPQEINSQINTLYQSNRNSLSNGLSAELVDDSEEWGEYVAERVIAFSQTDQEAEEQIVNPQPFSYEPPVGPGFWTYSADAERAWFPYWGDVRTFVISSNQTSSVAPPITYSEQEGSAYYNEMYEVYETNNSALAQDGEDLWVAEFWSDDVEGLMMSPPGRQISIAQQLINLDGMDYTESLPFLLKLGFALNDAAVSSWADKYEYLVMRPSVYIQDMIDPDFQTNLYRFIFWPNPSFPGYPSGHSTFASAAGGVFIDTFGDIPFTDFTHDDRTEFRGAARSFTSISEMAEENAFSRIPLGVHIRMDCTEGLRLGYEISDAVNNMNLQ